jgi:hypothetical protein
MKGRTKSRRDTLSGGDIKMSLLLAGRWCNIDQDKCRTQEKRRECDSRKDETKTRIDSTLVKAQLARAGSRLDGQGYG